MAFKAKLPLENKKVNNQNQTTIQFYLIILDLNQFKIEQLQKMLVDSNSTKEKDASLSETKSTASNEHLSNGHMFNNNKLARVEATKEAFQSKNKFPILNSIKNLIKDNIGFEGAQALIRIFDNKNVFLKIFWVVCLLGSNLICGYLLLQTLLTYLSFQVFTTATTVNENPAVFPKITICNSALGTTEYALNLIKAANEEVSPNISIIGQNQLKNMSWSDQLNLMSDIVNAYFRKVFNLPDESKKKLVHPFDDILIYCSFGYKQCTSADFVWRYDPVYGNCYSFNSGFNSTGSAIDLKKSYIPGAAFGLSLLVYVGYNEKLNWFNCGWLTIAPFTSLYGLNVVIENNTYLTDNKMKFIGLDGGTINYMLIQRKLSSKIPKPYSGCDIDNDSPGHFDSVYYNSILNSSYQYSQEFCINQCLQLQVLQMCNCTYLYLFALSSLSCQNEDQLKCTVDFYYGISKQLESASLACLAQCPLECNSTEYTFEMTSQRSSGYGYNQIIEQNPNLSSDFNTTPITSETSSNKFVQLNVFYDSLTYSISTDTPSMDMVSFLANVGGTLGLFLGLSLLSVCELIHVLVEIVLASINKSKNNKVFGK